MTCKDALDRGFRQPPLPMLGADGEENPVRAAVRNMHPFSRCSTAGLGNRIIRHAQFGKAQGTNGKGYFFCEEWAARQRRPTNEFFLFAFPQEHGNIGCVRRSRACSLKSGAMAIRLRQGNCGRDGGLDGRKRFGRSRHPASRTNGEGRPTRWQRG